MQNNSDHLAGGAGGGGQGVAEITGYSILTSDDHYAEEILIQRARQIKGPPLWAVRLRGNCLNKDGEWEYEPTPSSRDDPFLARCRFESADEAIRAATIAHQGSAA